MISVRMEVKQGNMEEEYFSVYGRNNEEEEENKT